MHRSCCKVITAPLLSITHTQFCRNTMPQLTLLLEKNRSPCSAPAPLVTSKPYGCRHYWCCKMPDRHQQGHYSNHLCLPCVPVDASGGTGIIVVSVTRTCLSKIKRCLSYKRLRYVRRCRRCLRCRCW